MSKKPEIVAQTEALKVRQDTPDDLNLLPKVGLEDVPAALHIVQGELREIISNRIDYPFKFISCRNQWNLLSASVDSNSR